MLESGISRRFAAWLPPIDSASRTASILYSSVYRRFGTSPFLLICSSVHQKITKILMYVKPGQGQPAYTRRLGQSTLLDELYAVIVWMGGEMLFADALEVPACHDPP